MLDRAPRGAPDAVDEALAQPARARLGVGGDDDLVVVLLAERVHDGRVGVGVHHLAVGLDAGLAQQRERHLEPVLGGVAHRRVVDHVAVLGLVLRADHVHVDLARRSARALDGVDQRLAGHRLVGDYEDPLHSVGGGAPPPPAGAGTAAPAGAFSLNTACTAPGHAVLVGAADDRRDLVEVEHRRRRGHLPLDRVRAPRVARGQRAVPPARRSCCRGRSGTRAPKMNAEIEMIAFQVANCSA